MNPLFSVAGQIKAETVTLCHFQQSTLTTMTAISLNADLNVCAGTIIVDTFPTRKICNLFIFVYEASHAR